MDKQKEYCNIEIIGEKIKSAYNRGAIREQIKMEYKGIGDVINAVYTLREHCSHLINSIWLYDDYAIIMVTPRSAIAWCELIDRRTNKK